MTDRATAERNAGGLAAVGGVLIALGSFLPWVKITSGLGSVTRSGMEGGDGVFSLVAGVVVLFGAAALLGWFSLSRMATELAIVLGGLFGLALAISQFRDVSERIDDVSTEFVTGSIGAGIWTIGLGGLLTLIGGFQFFSLRRAEAVSSEPGAQPNEVREQQPSDEGRPPAP